MGESRKDGDDNSTPQEKKTIKERFSDLLARVISAIFIVLIMVILLWWGKLPFLVGIILLVAIGIMELNITLSRHGYQPAIYLALPAGVALPLISFFLRETPQDLAVLVGALFVFLALTCLYYIVRPGIPYPTAGMALTFMGVFLISFSLSHFVLMLRMDSISWTVPFTVIVMVWVYDAVAYFVGSALGRHKMSPRVSPNKSWEGTLGGTLGAFIAAWILYLTVDRPWLTLGVALVLAAIVSVAGPIGDLTESLIKRELGIKDMSSLIPGHGGILDRFDSMMFTAVFSYYYLRFIVKV